MKMPARQQGNKALKNRLSFHGWRFHQFPILFPFRASGVNEHLAGATGSPR